MKYRTLKVMPKFNNAIGDIVDITDMGENSEVIENAIKDGFIEICDQSLKNKHCLVLAEPINVELKVNQV